MSDSKFFQIQKNVTKSDIETPAASKEQLVEELKSLIKDTVDTANKVASAALQFSAILKNDDSKENMKIIGDKAKESSPEVQRLLGEIEVIEDQVAFKI